MYICNTNLDHTFIIDHEHFYYMIINYNMTDSSCYSAYESVMEHTTKRNTGCHVVIDRSRVIDSRDDNEGRFRARR